MKPEPIFSVLKALHKNGDVIGVNEIEKEYGEAGKEKEESV